MGPSGADRTQVGPMLTPWTVLSGFTWYWSRCCRPLINIQYFFQEPDYSFPMEEVIGGELSGSIPGAVIGDAKLIRGVRSQALYVNGLDQRVDLGDQRHNCMGDLNKCNRGFVMAMWLRIHRYDGPGGLNDAYYISNGGHTSKSMGVALLMREQRLLVMFRTENRLWKVYYENDVSLHAWYHVVLTWSITSGGNVYINGALAGHNQGGQSGFYNREGNTFINFVLGDNNQNPPQQPGEMTLDELRIWDIITDDQWIWELYAADALP